MDIQFIGLPSDQVIEAKRLGRDAYGLSPETDVSDGMCPCRHCLKDTPGGEAYLTFAWRPFAGVNPYTETGPLFLCASDCTAAPPSLRIPVILSAPKHIFRGYDGGERIVYGTGDVVPTPGIVGYAHQIFENLQVAFVDVRSASNNCFLCRVRRA